MKVTKNISQAMFMRRKVIFTTGVLSTSRYFLSSARMFLYPPEDCSDMHDRFPVYSKREGSALPDPFCIPDICGRLLP